MRTQLLKVKKSIWGLHTFINCRDVGQIHMCSCSEAFFWTPKKNSVILQHEQSSTNTSIKIKSFSPIRERSPSKKGSVLYRFSAQLRKPCQKTSCYRRRTVKCPSTWGSFRIRFFLPEQKTPTWSGETVSSFKPEATVAKRTTEKLQVFGCLRRFKILDQLFHARLVSKTFDGQSASWIIRAAGVRQWQYG